MNRSAEAERIIEVYAGLPARGASHNLDTSNWACSHRVISPFVSGPRALESILYALSDGG